MTERASAAVLSQGFAGRRRLVPHKRNAVLPGGLCSVVATPVLGSGHLRAVNYRAESRWIEEES